ncbi:phage portal protein [Microbacterium sp.]|uniref:phage portal protein n=1 Tax=Microbacterium sp. TaxID=51671 RepID=UPI002810B605|nr:phage portal protein [Microbacterium sp.]
MGLWDFLTGWPAVKPAPVLPVSPFMPPENSLMEITVASLWPEHDTSQTLTVETALRIGPVKRSYELICGVLARMPWKQYDENGETPVQPRWLVNSSTGIAPRNLRYGVYGDLFLHGWAVIGFELGEDRKPIDALHIPRGWWSVDPETGRLDVDGAVSPRYRQHLVAIPLGYNSNGLMTDGADVLKDARAINAAYRDRIENPVALTLLKIAADNWGMWSAEEREEFRKQFMKARSGKGGATGMLPDWVDVQLTGQLPTDLFESGRNANRLDIANHVGVPASLLEGSKQSGGGDIHYSTEANGATRNELWDFGLSKFADAVEARLSLDDICAEGLSIRVDPSAYLVAPNPTTPTTSED